MNAPLTKEEELVVNQLERYFLDHTRSGAKRHIKHKPKHGKSAAGWDLQVERKNQVLLIEAKFIQGPFASALAGLIIAPLVMRREQMKSRKSKRWAAVTCWAIGCGWPIARGDKSEGHNVSRIYQLLFDYFARNLKFWKCYSKTLNFKYLFFVDEGKVARIRFIKMLNLVKRYEPSFETTFKERQQLAAKLMDELTFA
jgi:hypothetical protein